MPTKWKTVYVDNDEDAKAFDMWVVARSGNHILSLDTDQEWSVDTSQDRKVGTELADALTEATQLGELIPLERAAQILAGAIGAARFIAGTVPNGAPIADEDLIDGCRQILRQQ